MSEDKVEYKAGRLQGLQPVNCRDCIHRQVCRMLKAVEKVNRDGDAMFFTWAENIASFCLLRKREEESCQQSEK